MVIEVYTGAVPDRRMVKTDFNEAVQSLLSYIPTFASGANATEENINNAEYATLAARDQAVTAAAAAAVTSGAFGTSVSTILLGAGSRSLTTQTGKNFAPGMKIILASVANPNTQYMYGTVISYNSGTGALELFIDSSIGSGTYSSWSITITGPAAGEMSGSGIDWTVETIDKTTESGKGFLVDTSLAPKTVTLHSNPETGDFVAIGDLMGKFAVNNCTIARNGSYIHGVAEDLILDVKNQRITLVYTGTVQGWVITELEPSGSQYEYMPYAVMHVQDQKAYNVDGGTSVADAWTSRDLNTVLKNDIAGASLASNSISLPAGEYYIEARGTHRNTVSQSTGHIEGIAINGSVVLKGMMIAANLPADVSQFFIAEVSGNITLTAPGVLTLVYHSGVGLATTGLGASNNYESIVDPTIPSIYADVKITKIGNNYAPKPVISSARLQPMVGLNPTCQVSGFDITVTGTNQLTITKGQCLDSTLTYPIAVTSDTVLAMLNTVNQIFHLFAVHVIASDTDTVRAYTSEADAAADATIDRFAWIDFWTNNGAGALCAGYSIGGEHNFDRGTEAVTQTLSGSDVAISFSTKVPPSRIIGFQPGGYGGAVHIKRGGYTQLYTTFTGPATDTDHTMWVYGSGAVHASMHGSFWIPYAADLTVTGSGSFCLHSVKLRR